MDHQFTQDELFKLFDGCIPLKFFTLTNEDTKDKNKTPEEIRQDVIKLAEEWVNSGESKVQIVKSAIDQALQIKSVTIFDLGGWFKILQYRTFLIMRREDGDCKTLQMNDFELVLQEMSNLVIEGISMKCNIPMGTFHLRGITIEHCEKALYAFS